MHDVYTTQLGKRASALFRASLATTYAASPPHKLRTDCPELACRPLMRSLCIDLTDDDAPEMQPYFLVFNTLFALSSVNQPGLFDYFC